MHANQTRLDPLRTPIVRGNQRGQSLLLFVLVLPLLLGFVTLVLDVGWAYFIKRNAQSASDSAALAAIAKAASIVGSDGTMECGTLGCQAETQCPATGNLQTACQYSAGNGFSSGGHSGRQAVSISAGTGPYAPGVSNTPVDYWVQTKAQEQLPQWFSGILTNFGLNPTAQSTAALRRINFSVSLQLLNRSSDCFVSAVGLGLVCGEDFLSLGNNRIKAENGIYMASSNGNGLGLPQIATGTVLGAINVDAPFTYIMGKGAIQGTNNGWSDSPKNGFPDSDYFTDPMVGRGQPPAPGALTDRPVPGGVITGNLLTGQPKVLPPGNYYATLPLLNTPTGAPVTVAGNVIFSDGQNPPCGGFCNYVFYGGLATAAFSNVTFSPGRYVFAGAQPVSGGPGVGLSLGDNSVVKDLTPLAGDTVGPNTDAGEIFIFTDKSYPGLTVPNALSAISFPQLRAGITAGVNTSVTLHGINRSSSALPSNLAPFAPVLIWQDQANSTVRIKTDGSLDLSCGGPCANVLAVPGSQQMVLAASTLLGGSGTNLYGTIYGPRGSGLTIVGVAPGDSVTGPLQIITGSLNMTVNTRLDLRQLPTPPTRIVSGLIQ